ncbi:hypothetical protein CBR_g17667 [Chara braunii]|uniref:Uncharacterized protein n=1 Tax=Chara braunii TaxID=69332 RepID=A0A388KVJ1_CHABU|nr:hypothetical protein CBR_g17667 [Chara braunii]|eukprot:GBG73953.1 hypothetical protein CBR_g17667 [Chara braunii]
MAPRKGRGEQQFVPVSKDEQRQAELKFCGFKWITKGQTLSNSNGNFLMECELCGRGFQGSQSKAAQHFTIKNNCSKVTAEQLAKIWNKTNYSFDHSHHRKILDFLRSRGFRDNRNTSRREQAGEEEYNDSEDERRAAEGGGDDSDSDSQDMEVRREAERGRGKMRGDKAVDEDSTPDEHDDDDDDDDDEGADIGASLDGGLMAAGRRGQEGAAKAMKEAAQSKKRKRKATTPAPPLPKKGKVRRQTSMMETFDPVWQQEFSKEFLQWWYVYGIPFEAARRPEYQRVRKRLLECPPYTHPALPTHRVISGDRILEQQRVVAEMVVAVRKDIALLRRLDRGGRVMTRMWSWALAMVDRVARARLNRTSREELNIVVQACQAQVDHMLEPAHCMAHLLNPRYMSITYFGAARRSEHDKTLAEQSLRYLRQQTGGDEELYQTLRTQLAEFLSREGDWTYGGVEGDREAASCKGEKETSQVGQWGSGYVLPWEDAEEETEDSIPPPRDEGFRPADRVTEALRERQVQRGRKDHLSKAPPNVETYFGRHVTVLMPTELDVVYDPEPDPMAQDPIKAEPWSDPDDLAVESEPGDFDDGGDNVPLAKMLRPRTPSPSTYRSSRTWRAGTGEIVEEGRDDNDDVKEGYEGSSEDEGGDGTQAAGGLRRSGRQRADRCSGAGRGGRGAGRGMGGARDTGAAGRGGGGRARRESASSTRTVHLVDEGAATAKVGVVSAKFGGAASAQAVPEAAPSTAHFAAPSEEVAGGFAEVANEAAQVGSAFAQLGGSFNGILDVSLGFPPTPAGEHGSGDADAAATPVSQILRDIPSCSMGDITSSMLQEAAAGTQGSSGQEECAAGDGRDCRPVQERAPESEKDRIDREERERAQDLASRCEMIQSIASRARAERMLETGSGEGHHAMDDAVLECGNAGGGDAGERPASLVQGVCILPIGGAMTAGELERQAWEDPLHADRRGRMDEASRRVMAEGPAYVPRSPSLPSSTTGATTSVHPEGATTAPAPAESPSPKSGKKKMKADKSLSTVRRVTHAMRESQPGLAGLHPRTREALARDVVADTVGWRERVSTWATEQPMKAPAAAVMPRTEGCIPGREEEAEHSGPPRRSMAGRILGEDVRTVPAQRPSQTACILESGTDDLEMPLGQRRRASVYDLLRAQHGVEAAPQGGGFMLRVLRTGRARIGEIGEIVKLSPQQKVDYLAKMMQLNVRRTFLGDYDWGFLCMPRLPWRRSNGLPPFLGKDDKVSILIAIVMGLQHSLAMVGGIITVPLMLTDPAEGNFSLSERNYLISAALIVSGLVSFVQVYQAKIPRTKYVLGSGLLSVMGVSVTFLPIAQQSMSMLRSCFCNGVPCIVGQTCKDCPVEATGHCRSAQDAYGEILGTVLVGCWLEVILSFCPPRVLRRIFPPVVTGVVVVLIGTSLVAVGFKYWGGGVDCADNVLTMKSECRGNGNSNLAFGSWEYIGLGLCVFGTLLLIELFGSPFMRNTQVFLGLLIGMIVASSVHVYRCVEECAPKCRRDCYSVLPPGVVYNSATQGLEGLPRNSTTFPSLICQNTCGEPQCNISCESRRYVTSQGIVTANWFTFLWVKRFKLGFYPPALIPISFAFIITMMECIGDITATTEASGLETTGSVYEESLQGGILADGLSSFFSALATTLPVTTFAQNNGVITFTRCASRRAGYACAISLIILGTISKFAATLLAIPNCVLGGMTTFLFMNVVTSGFNVLASEGEKEKSTRKRRRELKAGVQIAWKMAPIESRGGSQEEKDEEEKEEEDEEDEEDEEERRRTAMMTTVVSTRTRTTMRMRMTMKTRT